MYSNSNAFKQHITDSAALQAARIKRIVNLLDESSSEHISTILDLLEISATKQGRPYWRGYLESILQFNRGVCIYCGTSPDDGIPGESHSCMFSPSLGGAFEDGVVNDFGRAPTVTRTVEDKQVPAITTDEVRLEGFDTNGLQNFFSITKRPDAEANEAAAEWGLERFKSEDGVISYACINCGTHYVSIEDRALRPKGVEGCGGCIHKTKFGG